MSSQRRVVVTGLGIVSPLGNDIDTSWQNIIEGKSGASEITKFDPSSFATHFAAELKGYDEISGISPKEKRRVDPFVQYAITASDQAIIDANLSLEDTKKEFYYLKGTRQTSFLPIESSGPFKLIHARMHPLSP